MVALEVDDKKNKPPNKKCIKYV